jgi:hypothetical protein
MDPPPRGPARAAGTIRRQTGLDKAVLERGGKISTLGRG